MKISLITRHAISNYGSLLQAYALQNVLEKMGEEVEIVNYIRTDEQYKNITKTLVKKTKLWNKNFLTRFVYTHLQNLTYVKSGRKFEAMQKKYLHLSKEYSSYEELKDNPPNADIYCTGSDQVWGPIGNDSIDKAYFLEYATSGKCISYAASFGRIKYDENVLNEINQYLQKYSVLALRENSAVDLVKNMGIENVEQVLDPTLLLSSSEWNEIAQKQKIDKEYVLIYQLHNNKVMDKYAEEFAEKVGLPLIRVTPMFHHLFRNGKKVYLPDLSEFLAYIRDAKYMITDSFHGTAFAINFNKQFIEILPGETATRNQSILELLHLQNRVVKDYKDFSFINEMISYDEVNRILETEREKSLEILKFSIYGDGRNE